MANETQLRQVALRCSQYELNARGSIESSIGVMGEEVRSCENCKHFTEDKKCDINLVDEIISNMDVKGDS
ncbi:hypothetical protein [Clostridiisalibacter paucivorans]|uniref:hypothetical protein n=1 Tax=Clostridiisalibacter paucivorans TaxID=408753 RepID=UPI00047D7916|nr:hypothetical protein [Clostridiisalibacter paucivorans]